MYLSWNKLMYHFNHHAFVFIMWHGGSSNSFLRMFVLHCANCWLRLLEQISLKLLVQLEQQCHLHVEQVYPWYEEVFGSASGAAVDGGSGT